MEIQSIRTGLAGCLSDPTKKDSYRHSLWDPEKAMGSTDEKVDQMMDSPLGRESHLNRSHDLYHG